MSCVVLAWRLPHGLRGTPFDPFGYTAERRLERRLIDRYETALRAALLHLCAANRDRLMELAELTDGIRGYGHVKQRNADREFGHGILRRSVCRGRAAQSAVRGAGIMWCRTTCFANYKFRTYVNA